MLAKLLKQVSDKAEESICGPMEIGNGSYVKNPIIRFKLLDIRVILEME